MKNLIVFEFTDGFRMGAMKTQCNGDQMSRHTLTNCINAKWIHEYAVDLKQV